MTSRSRRQLLGSAALLGTAGILLGAAVFLPAKRETRSIARWPSFHWSSSDAIWFSGKIIESWNGLAFDVENAQVEVMIDEVLSGTIATGVRSAFVDREQPGFRCGNDPLAWLSILPSPISHPELSQKMIFVGYLQDDLLIIVGPGHRETEYLRGSIEGMRARHAFEQREKAEHEEKVRVWLKSAENAPLQLLTKMTEFIAVVDFDKRRSSGWKVERILKGARRGHYPNGEEFINTVIAHVGPTLPAHHYPSEVTRLVFFMKALQPFENGIQMPIDRFADQEFGVMPADEQTIAKIESSLGN